MLGPVVVYAPKASVILLVLVALVLPDKRAAIHAVAETLATRFGAILGLFLVWTMVSSTWSPAPLDALAASVKIVILTLVGLFAFVSTMVTPLGRESLAAKAVICAPFVASFFLCLESWSSGALGPLMNPSYQRDLVFTSRGSAALAILTPAVVALMPRGNRFPWVAGLLVALAFVAVVPLPMSTSVLALAGGLVVGAGVWFLGPWMLRGAVVLVIGAMLASPWVFTQAVTQASFGDRLADVPTSLQHRLGIWEFAATRTLDRPLFGHGFDASREIDRAERGLVHLTTPGLNWDPERMPLHPHNIALQLWLELGVIGIVLFSGLLVAVAQAIQRAGGDRVRMAAHSATLISVLVFMSLSFGAWQSWWIAMLWIMAIVCAASPPKRQDR